MSVCYTEEIKRLRLKADQCRLDAECMLTPQTKMLVLRIARTFDEIADIYQTLERP